MSRIRECNKCNTHNLNKVMAEQCQYLKNEESKILLSLLRKFEDMFESTLGTWNTTPVDLELKDDAKPVCSRPYPVLRVHEAIFRKEVERLIILGVLEEEIDSKRGASSFPQPKVRTNRVIFISDFRNLNRQLKRKP